MGQSRFSQKELHGVNCRDIKIMLAKDGPSWEEQLPSNRQGRLIFKESYEAPHPMCVDKENPEVTTTRTRWTRGATLLFTDSREVLVELTDLRPEQDDVD